MLAVAMAHLLLCAHASSAPAGGWRDAAPGEHLEFPHAFYFQPDYRVQWWYFTGHLIGEQNQEYGFEVTFFAVGIQRRNWESEFGMNQLFISHAAMTDVEGGKFFDDEVSSRGAFDQAGASTDSLRVWVGKNRLSGTPDAMTLEAEFKDVELFLTLTPRKPPVLHGEAGYSRKAADSPGHASLYFSLTDIAVDGVLGQGDLITTVKGRAWFDREIFSQSLGRDQAGWDWFSLRLDDGREVMLYHLRHKDGGIDEFSSGTIVEKDGSARQLRREDFSIEVMDQWTSPRTRAKYPSRWKISVPGAGIDATVTPLLADQEFNSRGTTGNIYWEGLCKVEGVVTGRAYVEMTGYAP